MRNLKNMKHTEKRRMNGRLTLVATVVVAIGSGAACATKGYVQSQVGEVNDKVEVMSGQVEGNEQRTRENDRRIGEVDQKAGLAADSADAAGRAASAADARAGEAGAMADGLDRAARRLIYEVVLTSDQANFGFGVVDLADEAKAALDTMIDQLAADPQNYYIEIEGHTDSVGTNQVNERVGLQRAEAAKRYLHEQHRVPLHKMNVISYGEEKPAAPNTTRAGRSQNRRVVIRVLS